MRLRRLPHRVALPLRTAYYVHGKAAWSVRLPTRLRQILGLDDVEARADRRLELGSGGRPTPGYIHVDLEPWSRHNDLRIERDGRIPLPGGWAREILAIHVLEHVHPSKVSTTLAEWRRVLRPGGRLQVHVPDSTALMTRFVAPETSPQEKWALMGAILGMYANKNMTQPTDLREPCDHHVLFDHELLATSLESAGFINVRCMNDETDVHIDGWQPLVERFSLIYEAHAPAGMAGTDSASARFGNQHHR